MKEFAPSGSKFFPLIVAPISVAISGNILLLRFCLGVRKSNSVLATLLFFVFGASTKRKDQDQQMKPWISLIRDITVCPFILEYTMVLGGQQTP